MLQRHTVWRKGQQMQFQHTMRGQSVTVNYGTNPQGQVAGVWVELADGGQADTTGHEDMAVWLLAQSHNEQSQALAEVPA